MLRKEFQFKELTIGLGAFALVFLCSWFISGCSPTSEKEIPLKKDASVFKTVAKEVAKEAPKKEAPAEAPAEAKEVAVEEDKKGRPNRPILF